MSEPPNFEDWWTQHCVDLHNHGYTTVAYYARFVMRESLRSAYEAGMRKAYGSEEIHTVHDDVWAHNPGTDSNGNPGTDGDMRPVPKVDHNQRYSA